MKYKSVKGLLTGDESLIPVTFIDKLEDILHGFLGILLFVISMLAAGYTLQRLIETRPFFPLGMIQAINDILFVVIILEIMRTVIVRFTDGVFQLDNFLIIGVIAAVRHILTVGASLTMTAGSAAQILLAWEDSEKLHRGLKNARFTAAHLAADRRRGWAQSVGEREAGVASVSAPVRGPNGKVIAAVSISGPIERLGRQPGRLHAAAVVATAERLTEHLKSGK